MDIYFTTKKKLQEAVHFMEALHYQLFQHLAVLVQVNVDSGLMWWVITCKSRCNHGSMLGPSSTSLLSMKSPFYLFFYVPFLMRLCHSATTVALIDVVSNLDTSKIFAALVILLVANFSTHSLCGIQSWFYILKEIMALLNLMGLWVSPDTSHH